ncbi:Tfp type 4 fimbrial pilin related signal peptide protein domain [Legionella wadsworthii]|uniref:Type II secretion system protein H n=1 Tax=Legionella wadsworthii TaxID=28088 RepID=A0A378LUA8_9GAMM|nr:GspH/FimT family protein [Legionella wadsworthii]STY29418.1 Tfp type 4 fimbrial pilin related signal peptide protein domain [Legionella wadsworthii]
MKIKGLTLIELLVTSSLLLSLSIIGISSYFYFMKKNEQNALIDEIRTAVQYAKIQAILSGKPVYLSPLDATSSWSKGMVLKSINKRNKNLELINQWTWNFPRWDLHWIGVRSTNSITFSTYPGQAISNGHFILTNKKTHEQIKIILNRIGRVKVSNNL